MRERMLEHRRNLRNGYEGFASLDPELVGERIVEFKTGDCVGLKKDFRCMTKEEPSGASLLLDRLRITPWSRLAKHGHKDGPGTLLGERLPR